MFGWVDGRTLTVPIGPGKYFCPDCEVYGLGYYCWMCGANTELMLKKEAFLRDQHARQP